MNKLTMVSQAAKAGFKEYGADISVAVGFGMAVAAVVASAKATPKALDLLEEARIQKLEVLDSSTPDDVVLEDEDYELTKVEKVKATWKPYLPTILLTSGSGACLIASRYISIKQLTAIGVAYKLTENEFDTYKNKVKDILGEKKHEDVQNKIALENIQKNPMDETNVTDTKKGDTLFYDSYSGRYFLSDIEVVRKIVNDLNYRLLTGGDALIYLNDLYYELGVGECKLGDLLAWGPEEKIEVSFSAQLTEDKKPCVVLMYENLIPYHSQGHADWTLPF